jgi:hypothetical protein
VNDFRKSGRDKIEVSLFHPSVADWLELLFGKYAWNKRVPMEWLLLPESKLAALWQGIVDGDGCQTEGKLTTTSRILADQFTLMTIKLGRRARTKIANTPGHGTCKHTSWDIFFGSATTARYALLGPEGMFVAVQKAEIVEDRRIVYNLTVEPSHSYVINEGMAVWNCRLLGWKTLPSVIKSNLTDPDERRFALVKRNLLRGGLDRAKFTELVRESEERTKLGRAMLAKRMGLQSEAKLEKLIRDKRKATDAATQKVIDSSKREMQLATNLNTIVSDLFQKYGETVPHGWIFFAYKFQMHLLLQMSPALKSLITTLSGWAEEKSEAIDDFLAQAIAHEFEKRGVDPKALDVFSKIEDGDPDVPADEEDEE